MIIKFSTIKLVIPLFFDNENNKVGLIPHQGICECTLYMMLIVIFCKKKTDFDGRVGPSSKPFIPILKQDLVRLMLRGGINSTSGSFSGNLFQQTISKIAWRVHLPLRIIATQRRSETCDNASRDISFLELFARTSDGIRAPRFVKIGTFSSTKRRRIATR